MALKFFSISLFLCVLITITLTAYTHDHNGRPGCKSEHELKRPWRNNFDPTRYWVCEEFNEPAVEVLCPDGQAYFDPELQCVNWEDWLWTEPYDPPTLA